MSKCMCIHIMSNIFLEFYNEFKIDITIQYGIIQYALCDYTIYQVYHNLLAIHHHDIEIAHPEIISGWTRAQYEQHSAHKLTILLYYVKKFWNFSHQ